MYRIDIILFKLICIITLIECYLIIFSRLNKKIDKMEKNIRDGIKKQKEESENIENRINYIAQKISLL